MAEMDTSFYNNKPVDQVERIGKIVDIQKGVNANKLFPLQQQRAQQELEQGQNFITQQHLQNAAAHMETLGKFIAPYLQRNDLTVKDLPGIGAEAVSMGIAKPEEVTQLMSQITGQNGQPPGPQDIKNTLNQVYLRGLDAHSQMQMMYGNQTAVNTGGQQIIGAYVPGRGFVPQNAISNTMSPSEMAQPTPAIGADAQGNPVRGQVPLGSVRTPTGGAIGGNALMGGAVPPPPSPNQLTGQVNPQAVDAVAANLPRGVAGNSPAGIPISGPPGFVQTDFAPGYAEAKTGAAAENVKAASNLTNAYASIAPQKAALGNLEAALDQFTSGPAADWSKVAKAFTNQVNPFGNAFDPKSIASQEEFAKQAVNLAQQQFQALGGTGTDAKLDSTMKTSPNEALSKMGNKGIIHLLKGNADAIKVMGDEWIQATQPPAQGGQGLTAADFPKFQREFNKSFDPRIFQSAYMTPDERKDMLKGLSKNAGELDRFKGQYNSAVDHGWIPDPRGQNAP